MRTSERRDLKGCPQKWWWSNVEGLRTPRSANPLWFGGAVHEALAEWYIPGTTRGEHPAITFDKVLQGERSVLVTNDDEEKEYVDARAMGIDMLNRYVDHWGLEPEKEYISPEYQGFVTFSRHEQVRFGAKIPAVKNWLKYHFTADGVWRNLKTGELWLDEHKTAASIWNDFLPLDDQAGSYWAVIPTVLRKKGLLKDNEDLAGIDYNFLRKALGDERPFIISEHGVKLYTNKPGKQNYLDAIGAAMPGQASGKETIAQLEEIAAHLGIEVNGEVSKSQPPAYFERFPVYRSRGERDTMIERIREEAFFSEAYRNGDLPVTKSPSLMGCRSCQFRRMCELDEQGDYEAVEEFKEFQYIKVDAYEAYREHPE
jgi:hypothetical protein